METADDHHRVFAAAQVVSWSDLDRLVPQCGVPAERIFVDDEARVALDVT